MSSSTKYSLNFKSEEVVLVLGKGNPGTEIQKNNVLSTIRNIHSSCLNKFSEGFRVIFGYLSDSTNPDENLMPLCRKKFSDIVMIVGLCKFSFQKCFRNSG